MAMVANMEKIYTGLLPYFVRLSMSLYRAKLGNNVPAGRGAAIFDLSANANSTRASSLH